MIKRYNDRSLLFGVPGILLQIVGRVLTTQPDVSLNTALVASASLLLGTALLLVGFAYYAMAKGRSPVWCLAAFLSCFGLIVLALLKDKSAQFAADQQGDGPNAPARPTSGNPYQS